MKRLIGAAVLIGLGLAVIAPPTSAEPETVDKIAAIVGNEIILASELANQIQMVAFQSGERPETEDEINQFQQRVLQQMISDRLFLIEARKDTTIVIRRDEIRQALDEQIARVIENFGTQENFLSALAAEGLSLRDLERQYEGDIENNLMRQRFIQRKLYDVSISKYEVEQFYVKFGDSIPRQPEAVKLAHVLLKVQPSGQIEDSVKALATALRQQILDGADFATVATEHSSLGAGANGGDLGYVERSDVVPEFARAAFKLNVGEISGVIRTQFGFHVVRCEDKRGDRFRLRHILLAVDPSAADTTRVIELADSLLVELAAGADFEEIAKTYSRDDETRAQGGELGWFDLAQLPIGFVELVTDWKTPGETKGVARTKFGFHLLKLLEYQSGKALDLVNDYDHIKELARQDKTGRIVDEWIAEIKQTTYVEHRLDEIE